MEQETEQRATQRLEEARLRYLAADARRPAPATGATRQMLTFCAGWQEMKRRQFEDHPDVQEAVLRMSAFYED